MGGWVTQWQSDIYRHSLVGGMLFTLPLALRLRLGTTCRLGG